jgi:AcrR family transcriptional regulator
VIDKELHGMAGRPREFDRQEALAKARDAFWARGYEGVSLADLVERLGLASARIYAAFGSKADLFREAVALYEAEEGGFADRALAEPDIHRAIARMLAGAVELYTAPNRPGGCMVVTAGTNCAQDNQEIAAWLADHRAKAEGQLRNDVDPDVLGGFYATFLHGLSVQARDGTPRQHLDRAADLAVGMLSDA